MKTYLLLSLVLPHAPAYCDDGAIKLEEIYATIILETKKIDGWSVKRQNYWL